MADNQKIRDGLTYAFGHLVASYARPDDAHASDSRDLAVDTLTGIDLPIEVVDAIDILAEHVAGNYVYTGEAEELRRAIAQGRL